MRDFRQLESVGRCAFAGSYHFEGCGRETNKDYAHFLQIAAGSAFELDYQILLAKDLNYIDEKKYLELNDKTDKIKRQLSILIKKVRAV